MPLDNQEAAEIVAKHFLGDWENVAFNTREEATIASEALFVIFEISSKPWQFTADRLPDPAIPNANSLAMVFVGKWFLERV